ncbi:hypothetical protein BBW65_06740 [Helicobacter enhydrae]|uniref:Autotransporter domain-containing protein n=1 Tax=Helicobacter enhydrae TaxID=222136 RepID=A0A1B1U6S9_9HELI|nr:hypothetical protein [Helicobacter enhydrae]ANV98507.1 hypothetical protein BBW65_06740 [Helicobacter enhydrae]
MYPTNNPLSHSFKPLIATSLALALSVSVTSAANCPSTSQNPICYGTGGTANTPYTGITFGDKSGFKELKYNTSTSIDNLTFQLQTSGNIGETLAGNNLTLSLGGNQAIFQLTNTGAGLQIKNLEVNFEGDARQGTFARKMNLNFNGTTQNTAFKGNITIRAGNSINDKVEAVFSKDMEGNLKVMGRKVDQKFLFNQIKTTFTFKNGANFKGSLENYKAEGGVNFIFEGRGNVEGNIKSYGYIQGLEAFAGYNTNVNNNFTFKGNENKIITTTLGEILAQSGASRNACNKILFADKGQIGEQDKLINIVAKPNFYYDNYHPNATAKAQNFILFKGEATLHLNKLETAHKDSYRRNIISLEGSNNTLTIQTIDSGVANSAGNTLKGHNLIGKGFLNNASEAKDLSETTTATSPTTANIARGTLTVGTIKGGGTNKILIQNLTVTTKIEANGGSNYINSSQGVVKIVGNVEATGSGINEFSLHSSTLTLQGTNNVITTLRGSGSNSIDIGSDTSQATNGFNLLTIGKTDATGLQANNLLFKVFADPNAPDATLGGANFNK